MKKILSFILTFVSAMTAFSQNLITQEIENVQKQNEGPYYITSGECIDLGLSVKWASVNLGASSYEEYGDLYSWGETKAKKKYSSDKSKFNKKKRKYLQEKGIIDIYNNLTKEYDAASVNLGGKWRMPTEKEMNELITKCKWFPRSFKDVNGFIVQGPNGNTIFLPYTPIANQSGLTTPERCNYRTSTACWYISVSNNIGAIYSSNQRMGELKYGSNFEWSVNVGMCIRPVQK